MDLTAQHCPSRKILEHRVWKLVNELQSLTSQLLSLVGRNHQAFISTKADCGKAEAEIAESCRQLQAHQAEHGC
jgi:hypothetical protein